MGWKHIDTGKRSATENMELDAALLLDLEHSEDLLLHLYDWEGPSVTYGHFIDPEKFLNVNALKTKEIHLAKRPTGGGIIFHNCDLAFSVLVPATDKNFSMNPLDNYAFINQKIIWAIQQMINLSATLLPDEVELLDENCKSFCMANPTKYDVMIQGKKIGGAAQRKTKHGYLHQGSIAIGSLPESFLQEVLAEKTQVVEGIRSNSFSLLGQDWSEKELNATRETLRQLLLQVFNDSFNE